jgi:hypothetical protein
MLKFRAERRHEFKLDENFGIRTQQIFRSAGHDVHTVRDEQLQGCPESLSCVTRKVGASISSSTFANVY